MDSWYCCTSSWNFTKAKSVFQLTYSCYLLSRDLDEAFHLLGYVLVSPPASVFVSWEGCFDCVWVPSSLEGVFVSSDGGMYSIWNTYSSLSWVGGFCTSSVMTALGRSDFWGSELSGPLKGCWWLIRPERSFQLKYVGGLPSVGSNVSKKPQWLMCNCVDTIALWSFSMIKTDPTCLGEGPKFMSSRALGSHLGNPPPARPLWGV